MRYIDKSNRCMVFDDFVTLYQGRLRNDWEKFKKIRGGSAIRLALHQHLWREQKGLCAYCEQEVPEKTIPESDTKSHLEHIRPKARPEFKHLTFQFENLVMSCEGFDLTAISEHKKEFCGHFKDNDFSKFDDVLFLNPTEMTDIETYFRYDSEGKIEPNPFKTDEQQRQTVYMIRTLNLNNAVLMEMRKVQYDLWLEKQFVLTEAELADELSENQRLLPAFFSLLKQKIL